MSLSPVPEDSLPPIVAPPSPAAALHASASSPHLATPVRWNSYSPGSSRSPSRSPHRGARPAAGEQQQRRLSYPPAKSQGVRNNANPVFPEFYAPSMRSASDGWHSPRGSTFLRESEYFYEPPAPGTVTVASSLSGIDMEDKPVWYRRHYMVYIYLLAVASVIGIIVAVIVVYDQ